MPQDTRICRYGETHEPRYLQTRVAQELAHEEFVTTGSSCTWAMVLQMQSLVRQGGSEHRGVTNGEDSVERLQASVVQNMLHCFLRSLEAQRQGPVLPGIVQYVTA